MIISLPKNSIMLFYSTTEGIRRPLLELDISQGGEKFCQIESRTRNSSRYVIPQDFHSFQLSVQNKGQGGANLTMRLLLPRSRPVFPDSKNGILPIRPQDLLTRCQIDIAKRC